jgi:gamma-glutamyltranspeptidase
VLKENESLVQTKLSETLEKLANSSDPLKLFYEGFIAQNIIHDIKEAAKEWNLTGIQLTNKLVLF